MLKAGLPIAEALELAKLQVTSSRLNLIVRLMLKDIHAGHALSYAMRKHGDIFPDMVVNLVIAAENTGELDVVMERMALHIEKKAALKSQTINAMIYPIVVVIAAIGVTGFMVTSIVPKFAKFLLDRGRELPPSTQFLVDVSDFVIANGLSIVGISIAVITSILIFYQTKNGRFILDSLLLKIPVIGPLLITASMAQMTWALSILLRSGITVYDSLKVVSNVLGNRVYSDHLKLASNTILTGRDMSNSLKHKAVPLLVLQMIAVGENTGSLDDVLKQLGIYYEELLENAIKRLTAMIEPALILVIGTIVGFVYYAFIQALMSIGG